MQINYNAQSSELSVIDDGTLLIRIVVPPDLFSKDTVLRNYVSRREWGLAFLCFQSFGADDYPYSSLLLVSWDGPLAGSLKPCKLIEQRGHREMSISLVENRGIRVQSPAIPATSVPGFPKLDKLYTVNSALSVAESE